MNVSNFRYKIVIEQVTKTKDSYGAEDTVWSTYKTLSASKKELGGTDVISNQEVFKTNTVEFTTHYREGITDDMRVVFNTEYYKILNIAEVGFKTGLIIRCEKIND